MHAPDYVVHNFVTWLTTRCPQPTHPVLWFLSAFHDCSLAQPSQRIRATTVYVIGNVFGHILVKMFETCDIRVQREFDVVQSSDTEHQCDRHTERQTDRQTDKSCTIAALDVASSWLLLSLLVSSLHFLVLWSIRMTSVFMKNLLRTSESGIKTAASSQIKTCNF